MTNKKIEEKDNSLLLSEYSIIKTELGNLFQKNGILSATSIFVIGIIIEICNLVVNALNNDLFWLLGLFLLFPLISLILSIIALFPNLNSTESKYFKDFAKYDVNNYEEVEKMMTRKNVAMQIIINSKILMRKYQFYKWLLLFLLPPLSSIPFILVQIKWRK